MKVPVIDEHDAFVEVWWNPPDLGASYRVLLDSWVYDFPGKPVRFVYVISED